MILYTKQEIYKTAFMLLDKFELRQIPVDIYTLVNKLNISLIAYSSLSSRELDDLLSEEKNQDAFSMFLDENLEKFVIYYDDSLTSKEIKDAIARELGKFIFSDLLMEDYEDIQDDFVSMLLVPMVSLFFIEELNIDEISTIFNVSRATSSRILDTYNRRLTKYGNRLFQFEADSFMQFD